MSKFHKIEIEKCLNDHFQNCWFTGFIYIYMLIYSGLMFEFRISSLKNLRRVTKFSLFLIKWKKGGEIVKISLNLNLKILERLFLEVSMLSWIGGWVRFRKVLSLSADDVLAVLSEYSLGNVGRWLLVHPCTQTVSRLFKTLWFIGLCPSHYHFRNLFRGSHFKNTVFYDFRVFYGKKTQ